MSADGGAAVDTDRRIPVGGANNNAARSGERWARAADIIGPRWENNPDPRRQVATERTPENRWAEPVLWRPVFLAERSTCRRFSEEERRHGSRLIPWKADDGDRTPRPSAWEVTAALGRVLSVAGGAAFLHRSWNAAEAEKDRFGRAVLT
jgi:hypothetical protein